MERDVLAYDAGIAEAQRDIASGQMRWFSGAPSQAAWGRDLAKTMRSRFAITVVFVSCLTSAEKASREEGYNSAVEAHVDRIWGEGALAAALAEVERRRKEAYHAWNAAEATRLTIQEGKNHADS